MRRFLAFAAMSVVFGSLSLLAGCGAKSEPSESEVVVTNEAPQEEPQSEIDRELAKLPEGDRELARAQRVCPVSGQPLGSMGVPIKVSVDGRSFFICCEACEEEAKKNFDKHLAKLENPSEAEAKE
jgi:hypothetical protein